MNFNNNAVNKSISLHNKSGYSNAENEENNASY